MKGKEHDAHFKNAFQINGPYLSSIINPEDEFGEIGPTEIISNKYNHYRADYTYFTKDKEYIINIEFQTNLPNSEDYFRFYIYASNLHVNYKKKVKTIILCTENIKNETYVYNFGKGNYEFILKSLKNYNGDKKLKIIKKKIINNKEINNKDLAILLLIPYMNSINIAETLFEKVCQITNNIKTDSLNKNILKASQITLLEKFIKNKSKQKEIMEIITMNSELLNEFIEEKYAKKIEETRQKAIKEGIEEGIEQGIEQGIEKGEEQIIKKLLKQGIPTETIQKATGKTLEQIEKLK